jgi:hypothetical protein
MSEGKRPRIYISDECAKKIEKTGLNRTNLTEQLIDLNERYNFLDHDWIKNLINSEIGEKIKGDLTEKLKRGVLSPLTEGIKHTCVYVCPFISEPNKIVCMRDWSLKSHLHKVPIETCNLCFDKGFVIPKPKTETELLEEREREAQQRRHQNYLATSRVGHTSFENLNTRAKQREKDRFRDSSI